MGKGFFPYCACSLQLQLTQPISTLTRRSEAEVGISLPCRHDRYFGATRGLHSDYRSTKRGKKHWPISVCLTTIESWYLYLLQFKSPPHTLLEIKVTDGRERRKCCSKIISFLFLFSSLVLRSSSLKHCLINYFSIFVCIYFCSEHMHKSVGLARRPVPLLLATARICE